MTRSREQACFIPSAKKNYFRSFRAEVDDLHDGGSIFLT
jgi:hypothetical protein